MSGKTVQQTEVENVLLTGPQHANHFGYVHGGEMMKLVDEVGAMVALRHAQRPVVTMVMDSMTFYSPVPLGNILTLKARLNWVGSSSMEVGVRVIAEDPLTGTCTHTNSAYVVYVALDDAHQPIIVPPLLIQTEDEQRRWQAAEERRAFRLRKR